MGQDFEITFQPINRKVLVPSGTTVMEAAKRASIKIRGDCGGGGQCGKCLVRIDSLHEQTAIPVLACQTLVNAPMTVRVTSDSPIEEAVAGKTDVGKYYDSTDPLAKRYTVDMGAAAPCVSADKKNHALSTTGKINQITRRTFRFPNASVLQQLSLPVNQKGEITLVDHLHHGVTAVFKGNVPGSLGFAFDIGTTTIAAYLCDMNNGRVLAVKDGLNPQCSYGEDVISRIAFANSSSDGLKILQQSVIQAMNQLIRSCLDQIDASREDVDEVTVVGNPTMTHILAGFHPHRLGIAPYRPITLHMPDQQAGHLNLDLVPGTIVYFFPVASGYIGGDMLAAILAEGAYHGSETVLIVDIGTNGEVALVTPQAIWATSCATGPAFEGGQISCGMRAHAGAVWAVRGNSKSCPITCRVIGEETGVKAAGICGSGIIDAVAVLCKASLIQANGRLNEKNGQVVCDANGIGRTIVLVPPHQSQSGAGVQISLHDIRQVQLAKAAMAAGIECLLNAAGFDGVDKIVLTGAFGARFNFKNAIDIGMFPDMLTNGRFQARQNLAGTGAIMALLSQKKRSEIEFILDHIHCLNMAEQSNFIEKFTMATQFKASGPKL